jgi:hypothetical protein
MLINSMELRRLPTVITILITMPVVTIFAWYHCYSSIKMGESAKGKTTREVMSVLTVLQWQAIVRMPNRKK